LEHDVSTRMYSIGHSRHSIERFLELLELHRIEVLVDVRSMPYSRFSPHFGIHALRKAVTEAGRGYVFLGKELGGRPEGAAYYDEEGHVLYGKRAEAPEFRAGLDQLAAEAGARRAAMMCSEENPEGCHRRLLVARALVPRGVVVDHIRGDGRLQAESELPAMGGAQGELFGTGGGWRSVMAVQPPKRAGRRRQ
jgi:uncharacterized protein (DUF488 family)